MTDTPDTLVELTAYVISAYFTNHKISVTDLTGLIAEFHGALGHAASGAAAPEPAPEPQKPAVPVKKSVGPGFIICLEDGKKFKSLKRHLRTAYSLTPQAYRKKWDLPADYPMVAPSYAAVRSELANKSDLGQQSRKR